jgi:hypothetical protein
VEREHGESPAITGQYQPFYYRIAAPANASTGAAAAAAAHRVLVNYFPSQQTALDSQFTTSLAGIADGGDKIAGVAVGEAAAMAIISARMGDGLEANISYTPGSGPGAWIPTPPAYAPPIAPWLGQMRPFTLRTAGDFLPDGPTALNSEDWKRDYNLTRIYGGTGSTIRSTAETEIGVFYTEHTGQHQLCSNSERPTRERALRSRERRFHWGCHSNDGKISGG